MALEEGAEVVAKEGPTKHVKVGPVKPHNLGGLGVLITLRTVAVEHTGDGASAHTFAAIQVYALGKTGSNPDQHNNNHSSNHSNKRNRPDNYPSSKRTGKKR